MQLAAEICAGETVGETDAKSRFSLSQLLPCGRVMFTVSVLAGYTSAGSRDDTAEGYGALCSKGRFIIPTIPADREHQLNTPFPIQILIRRFTKDCSITSDVFPGAEQQWAPLLLEAEVRIQQQRSCDDRCESI